MIDAQILDIFYTKIVPEAQKGKIDCYFTLNIVFNLIIDNKEISKYEELPYEGILIPTLKITNKQLFDSLLISYVKKTIEFYDSSNFSFLSDIDTIYASNANRIKQEYLIKYIIGTLFANASLDDFNNPIEFLCSRIAMFDNRILNCEDELELGYIDSIGAKIYVIEEKSSIRTETPYRIKSYLEFDDGYKLSLPEIYVGNNGNKYKLYAIQKTDKNSNCEDANYLKKLGKV